MYSLRQVFKPSEGLLGETCVKADFGRIVGIVANEIKQINESFQQAAGSVIGGPTSEDSTFHLFGLG